MLCDSLISTLLPLHWQRQQLKVLPSSGNCQRHTPTHDLHVAQKYPYVHDFNHKIMEIAHKSNSESRICWCSEHRRHPAQNSQEAYLGGCQANGLSSSGLPLLLTVGKVRNNFQYNAWTETGCVKVYTVCSVHKQNWKYWSKQEMLTKCWVSRVEVSRWRPVVRDTERREIPSQSLTGLASTRR
jgi:hypothetical protein